MSHHVALICSIVGVLCSASMFAQQTTPLQTGSGGSPHVRTAWTIDGAKLSIEYGRPYLKGRSEAEMMPHGQVWRTGADAQTTLVVDKPLKFGSLIVPAGTYGLHTLPGRDEWQLIISKRASGWGIPYPSGQDLGRVPMKMSRAGVPSEQLTIHVDDTAGGGVLRIEWGTVSVSTPFTVG